LLAKSNPRFPGFSVRAFGGDDIVTLVAGGQIVFLVCGAILVSAHGLFLGSSAILMQIDLKQVIYKMF
jgi:hypothetical protein